MPNTHKQIDKVFSIAKPMVKASRTKCFAARGGEWLGWDGRCGKVGWEDGARVRMCCKNRPRNSTPGSRFLRGLRTLFRQQRPVGARPEDTHVLADEYTSHDRAAIARLARPLEPLFQDEPSHDPGGGRHGWLHPDENELVQLIATGKLARIG